MAPDLRIEGPRTCFVFVIPTVIIVLYAWCGLMESLADLYISRLVSRLTRDRLKLNLSLNALWAVKLVACCLRPEACAFFLIQYLASMRSVFCAANSLNVNVVHFIIFLSVLVKHAEAQRQLFTGIPGLKSN